MTDIQRYGLVNTPHGWRIGPMDNGAYIWHEDHAEALRQAVQRAYDERSVYSEAEVEAYNTKHYDKGRAEGYEKGQRDARESATRLAREQHRIILMLLDEMHGNALIDPATQEDFDPNRVVKWWRDERRFLHIAAIKGEQA